ncbi:MAG TPA: ABC transporter ATP-binding protein, partial [Hyphomicrobiales bacterium]|nr:ABC transporter ATP-binding protein [Hyphomicrobiales bacterium]
MAISLVAGVIELSLFAFLGQLVDLARESQSPAKFFEQHGNMLLLMLAVAVIIRPIAFAVHILLVNQTVNANFTNLIRWQNHRYVLRQSLSFFQNDFAGRIANRIMQTGPSLRQTMVQLVDALWFVVVYTVGAIILFSKADVWLIAPLLIWLVLYISCLAYFVPQLKNLAAEMSEARSTLMGRIVDSYTNITTVKLFAHTKTEDQYARSAVQ